MPKDAPGYDRDAKERGLYANDSHDPTLAGYLSSLLLALSVPSGLALVYGGLWLGYWGWGSVLPVLAGYLVCVLVLAVVAMAVLGR